MNNPTIIFIHGYTASRHADWYPNIAAELKVRNISYEIPTLLGDKHPHANHWIEKIHKVIEKIRGPIILVGHSLGTRAALLYLERYPTKLHALVLIAAFANRKENAKRKNEHYADFFEKIVDTDAIKSLTSHRIVIHSTDDDSIAFEQGEEIARDLDAKLLTYNNRGHFSDPENYSYIFDVIQNILNMK